MQTEKDRVTKNTSSTLDKAVELRRHPSLRPSVVPLLHAWAAAVSAGGDGNYARALTELATLERVAGVRARVSASTDPHLAVLSLCQSTRASLVRQAGRHHVSHVIDGRALLTVGISGAWAVPGAPGSGPREVSLIRAAVADGLVGLAADNLGLLRFDASRRLLDRARTVLDPMDVRPVGTNPEQWSWRPADADWMTATRCRLRWEWVSAELGLYRGDVAAGLEHARAGALLVREMHDAATPVPARHRVKTALIAAAAAAGAGDRGGTANAARDVVADAHDEALLPLEWAAMSLLLGTGAASGDEAVHHRRLRATLIGKGMALMPDG